MQTFSSKPTPNHNHILSGLVLFSAVILFYALSDAIMSYMAPNIVENLVHNDLLMGIIISLSSAVGLICDFVFSNVFKEKSFYQYLFWGLVIAISFPLALMMKSSLWFVVLGMAVWGVYFESILFAKSNYIHHCLPHDKHDVGWVYINAFSNLGYIIGPSIAVWLSTLQFDLSLHTALACQVIAIIGALIFKSVFGKQIKNPIGKCNHASTIWQGFSLWKILNRRLWPVLTYRFCIILIDSAFWTVGAILVNRMKDTHPLAGLLYVVYSLPALIVAPLGIKISQHIGKKRTAFLMGLVGGGALTCTYFTNDFNAFMICIAICAIALAIGTPEIHGAIEDYCERLGHRANSLVGLTSSMGSVAYIIGPIISGAIATAVGEQRTFGIVGAAFFLCSLIDLIIVPRKIHLPQKEIATVM